jgi:hypothetical protein
MRNRSERACTSGVVQLREFSQKETYTSWQIKIPAKVVNRAAKAASKAAAGNRSLDSSKVVSKVAAAKSLVSNSKSPERAASRNPKESSTSQAALPRFAGGFLLFPVVKGRLY